MKILKIIYFFFILKGLKIERKYAVNFWYQNRNTSYEKYCLTVIDRIDFKINGK